LSPQCALAESISIPKKIQENPHSTTEHDLLRNKHRSATLNNTHQNIANGPAAPICEQNARKEYGGEKGDSYQ
jgi:hypothetical protein